MQDLIESLVRDFGCTWAMKQSSDQLHELFQKLPTSSIKSSLMHSEIYGSCALSPAQMYSA